MMIDEQVLERALAAEAGTYVPPPDGPATILAGAGEMRPVTTRRNGVRWRTAVLGAAAAVVAGVLAVSVAGGRTGLDLSEPSSLYTSGKAAGGGDVAADETTRGGLGENASASAKVVRTADVNLEVPRGRVPATLAELSRLATAHRGFVSGSSSATTREAPYGTVTLRVPTGDLDAVLAEVGRLGTVVSSDSRGEDVTGEVTDVEARLRSLTAARAQLQALLARAKTVGEVLAVQEQVTEVQTQIEQLQGRQKSLADRTTYATVTVSVTRNGGHDAEPEGFAKAWRDARDGFVGGFRALVAASGTIAFLLIVGGVLLLLGRKAYRLFVRRVV
jgi:hypothetical protein